MTCCHTCLVNLAKRNFTNQSNGTNCWKVDQTNGFTVPPCNVIYIIYIMVYNAGVKHNGAVCFRQGKTFAKFCQNFGEM